MNKKVAIGIIAAIVIIALLGFGLMGNKKVTSSQGVSSSNSNGNEIIINGFRFSPDNLNVKVGDKVTWVNQDSAGHTITSDSGSVLNSPILKNGESFSFTFTSTGEYSYHCSIHPGMKGKIIVS
jgi:amicyanin